jgi:hypothetical protein
MSATVGALNVDLSLSTATFEATLKRTQDKLVGFHHDVERIDIGGALTKIFDTSKLKLLEDGAARINVFGSALEKLGGIGIAAGVGIGAAAIALEGAKKAFEFSDKIELSAARIGISTKALQEYQFAVHKLGGEYTDADTALAAFSRAFGLAEAGFSKRATKPFAALGLDAASFKTTEDAFNAVIDKISKLKSTAEQAAIADKLGLTAILPAIRAGLPAIEDLRAAAERLGFVMDEAAIKKGAEAGKTMSDLARVLQVQVNTAFVDLAPLILNVAQKFVEGANALRVFTDHLADLASWVKGSEFGQLLSKLSGLAAAMNPLGFVGQELKMVAGKLSPAAPAGGAEGSAAPPVRDGSLIPQDGKKAKKAKDNTDASLAAIETARKAELAAQIALTGGTEALAKLKKDQIDRETDAENDKLIREAADKKITTAARDTAVGLNNKAAIEKKDLIDRQTAVALGKEAIAQQQLISGYYNQIASLTASLATNAADRN